MLDDNEELDIYKIKIDKKLNKNKVLILILCILILLCLIIITKNSMEVIKGHKIYKQYETQLQSITYQEEQKQAKIKQEEERKIQERKPKLTDKRKNKY